MLTPDEFKQLADNIVISASSSVQNDVSMGEYAIGLAFEANAYPILMSKSVKNKKNKLILMTVLLVHLTMQPW